MRGERETTRQIVLYSIVLVAFTLAVGLWLGPVYTVAAAVLGGAFLALAWQLRRDTTPRRAAILFHYSLAYLALLFVAAAANPVLPVKELTPELERKNLLLGWALFGIFLLLFAGTVGVALLYLALD